MGIHWLIEPAQVFTEDVELFVAHKSDCAMFENIDYRCTCYALTRARVHPQAS
jgi:hypothetical protein